MHPRAPLSTELEDWAYPLARQVVKPFASTWPDHAALAEDLVQAVVEHWWLKRSKFDEDGSATAKTYAATVMRNELRDLYEHAIALKRGGGHTTVSLYEPAIPDQPDGDQLVEHLSGDDDAVEDIALADLRSTHVDRFRSTLSAGERDLIDALAADPRPRPAARRLGIAPSTVYRRIERLRRRAEDSGLRHWL